jgi:serine/threonine protein kinase
MLLTVHLKEGDVIKLSSGTFFIEKILGSGGFGTVFKGIKDNKYYAIKLNRIWELLPNDREEIRKRIKLEYTISNSIHSDHIVHSYSYDEINENPLLVMDYCPDGNLREKIGQYFTNDQIYRTILQILSGLSILHSII